MNSTPVDRLRIAGIIEGISFLILLFIAMPLKYLFNQPQAVKMFGTVHGALFVAYCLVLLIVSLQMKWGLGKMILGFIAGVIPFGFLVFEKQFRKA